MFLFTSVSPNLAYLMSNFGKCIYMSFKGCLSPSWMLSYDNEQPVVYYTSNYKIRIDSVQ